LSKPGDLDGIKIGGFSHATFHSRDSDALYTNVGGGGSSLSCAAPEAFAAKAKNFGKTMKVNIRESDYISA
jgi:hypothetical protein